jgi:hypothetical protein
MKAAQTLSTLLIASLLAAGCAGDDGLSDLGTPDDEYGMDGPLDTTPPIGKADSEHRRGLWVNTNTRATQVWSARNKWEDTSTAAAKKAGMAWGEDSGLNWDQKFAKWVESMGRIDSVAGYYDTFELTTPWGKTLPSPKLECAEMMMFLRMTFAAWYELPFFMETRDRHGTRLYIGHNGIRTKDGRYKNTPNYGYWYKDYSKTWESGQEWPNDSKLRGRKLYGGTDDQSDILGDGATFGTYVDEIHLNKRAGYFTMLAINYLGSMNLADTANTYNIVPESVRPGDVLVERWQLRGIGHTLVVKGVTEIGEGNLDVTLVSGSMPRRQGKWESGVASKQTFTSNYTGGPGTASDGNTYCRLGGGLKRYRVTKNVNGYWTNTWMNADEAHWINSTDCERITARPARFEQMLGQVSPQQLKTELVAQIEDARRHLENYPASCAARERRERAFEALYDLAERSLGMTRSQIDAQYRDDMDYVLAELVYNQSKTCCWNSTTNNMYQIIRDYAAKEKSDAEAEGMCVKPTVFMNHSDGYERWRAFAEARGQGAQWVAWSEDESCSQRDVAADTEQPTHQWTEYCSLPGGGGTPQACTDSSEPNNSLGDAATLTDTISDLRICDGDADYFRVASGGTVVISFTHAEGDLDMAAYDADGNRTDISQGTSDTETLTVGAGAIIKVYGYNGATGDYDIRLQ